MLINQAMLGWRDSCQTVDSLGTTAGMFNDTEGNSRAATASTSLKKTHVEWMKRKNNMEKLPKKGIG